MRDSKYHSVDEAYKNEYKMLCSMARKRLHVKNNAEDIVQSVFEKLLDYKVKYPDSRIRSFYLKRNVIIACSKDNKGGKGGKNNKAVSK